MPKVDLVLTDPPYGIGINHGWAASKTRRHHPEWAQARSRDYGSNDWDVPIEQSAFDCLVRFAPKTIIWGGNFYVTPRASGWLVWDKHTTGDFADCELAFTTLPIAVRRFSYLWNGYRQEGGIRHIRQHLTEKPIPLMRWCIGLAKDVSSVIDPYMGSGTSCERLRTWASKPSASKSKNVTARSPRSEWHNRHSLSNLSQSMRPKSGHCCFTWNQKLLMMAGS